MDLVVREFLTFVGQGLLGHGVYFTPNAVAAAKYTSTSTQSNTRLIGIANVALGNVKHYYSSQPDLPRPPINYHSAHGIQSTPLLKTDFEEEQFVIYDLSQQKLEFVVEVQLPGDLLGTPKSPPPAMDVAEEDDLSIIEPRDRTAMDIEDEDLERPLVQSQLTHYHPFGVDFNESIDENTTSFTTTKGKRSFSDSTCSSTSTATPSAKRPKLVQVSPPKHAQLTTPDSMPSAFSQPSTFVFHLAPFDLP